MIFFLTELLLDVNFVFFVLFLGLANQATNVHHETRR
jgi:hypothetical protein